MFSSKTWPGVLAFGLSCMPSGWHGCGGYACHRLARENITAEVASWSASEFVLTWSEWRHALLLIEYSHIHILAILTVFHTSHGFLLTHSPPSLNPLSFMWSLWHKVLGKSVRPPSQLLPNPGCLELGPVCFLLLVSALTCSVAFCLSLASSAPHNTPAESDLPGSSMVSSSFISGAHTTHLSRVRLCLVRS